MVEPRDAIVDAAIAACARAWPDVRLDRETVIDRVRLVDLTSLDRRHLGDLGLAWACLAGDPAAQRAIDGMIRAEAQRAVTAQRRPAWLVDEVHGELGQRLLVAEHGAAPRLATYAGQSALGRWLGVAATRTTLNVARRMRPETAIDDADDEALAAVVAPELAIVRARYREEVEQSIRAAFASLDSARDRNLLRMYYLDRVGLDRLGQLFGVHASTVSRWLAALRESIFEDTRARLSERLGIAGNFEDVDSVIRAVRSDLDLTLSRILKASA